MRYLKASLITAVPLLGAPIAINWLVGFVAPSVFAPLPLFWRAVLVVGTYLATTVLLYGVTRLLSAACVLSRRSLVTASWTFGLVLGALLWYVPGSPLLSAGMVLGFSLVVAACSAPLVWLWWFSAQPSGTSA